MQEIFLDLGLLALLMQVVQIPHFENMADFTGKAPLWLLVFLNPCLFLAKLRQSHSYPRFWTILRIFFKPDLNGGSLLSRWWW